MRHLIALLLATSSPVAFAEAIPEKVEYNRDVRPILSDNCFFCHGPDANHREADLRLDLREAAIEKLAPGKPNESELVARIISQDPDLRMPPPEANKELTPQQIEILKRWVEQGAGYQKHWSYEPPVKPAIPAGQQPIDHLVRKRLAAAGLKPSPEADRRTLIRRLSLDLLGLPPTPQEVDAFVNALRLFGIGYSWGGPMSLAVPYDLDAMRSGTARPTGHLVRFSIGLEAVEDLRADLQAAMTQAFG